MQSQDFIVEHTVSISLYSDKAIYGTSTGFKLINTIPYDIKYQKTNNHNEYTIVVNNIISKHIIKIDLIHNWSNKKQILKAISDYEHSKHTAIKAKKIIRRSHLTKGEYKQFKNVALFINKETSRDILTQHNLINL